MCDYAVVRRGVLRLPDLYDAGGAYRYLGVNRRAMVAVAAGILAPLAGLADTRLGFLFSGAWFSATLVSGLCTTFSCDPRVSAAAYAVTEE